MTTTATTALTEFLLARIAEDEENAGRYLGVFPDGDMAPVFRRVLVECEAKRRIVELRYSWNLQAERNPEPPFGPILQTQVNTADAVLRALALAYADHPDYREEWRP